MMVKKVVFLSVSDILAKVSEREDFYWHLSRFRRGSYRQAGHFQKYLKYAEHRQDIEDGKPLSRRVLAGIFGAGTRCLEWEEKKGGASND